MHMNWSRRTPRCQSIVVRCTFVVVHSPLGEETVRKYCGGERGRNGGWDADGEPTLLSLTSYEAVLEVGEQMRG
jgi:hypothetical protein